MHLPFSKNISPPSLNNFNFLGKIVLNNDQTISRKRLLSRTAIHWRSSRVFLWLFILLDLWIFFKLFKRLLYSLYCCDLRVFLITWSFIRHYLSPRSEFVIQNWYFLMIQLHKIIFKQNILLRLFRIEEPVKAVLCLLFTDFSLWFSIFSWSLLNSSWKRSCSCRQLTNFGFLKSSWW